MLLYIIDFIDDEFLFDYSVLKEVFMVVEVKVVLNIIIKILEGLKVDIFKENIGIFLISWYFFFVMFNKLVIEFMMLFLKYYFLILFLFLMFFKGIEREVILLRIRFIDFL